MSDIKSVIELLCKHLSCISGVNVKPDYFRLAKYNKSSKEAIEVLWAVLHILSSYAVTERNKTLSFEDYDRFTRTKLNFAYLQYPAVAFYTLPETDTFNSRELLLALAWLFTSENVMETTVKSKLISSTFGKEYASKTSAEVATEPIEVTSLDDQMKNIVHICYEINHNLKAISELISEKVKLTTRVHAASIDTSGLPHLSVFEMAMTKRFSFHKKNGDSGDGETIHSLHNVAAMLDYHLKWVKKQHIFYEWMITVIEENKNVQKPIITEDIRHEILRFVLCLRHTVKKKLHALKHPLNYAMPTFDTIPDCTSRLLRTQSSDGEAADWLTKGKNELDAAERGIEIKEKELLKELKSMLKFIPNCVRVS